MNKMVGVVNILFTMDADAKKKLELIAGPRGVNKLLRKINEDWLDEHYPDQTAIVEKLNFHREEIVKLERHLANIGHVEATQSMEGRERVQFLKGQEDAILNMLWITYIKKRADNEYYNNWAETLQFDSKSELKAFLKSKWEETSPDEVTKLQHKRIFKENRIKDLNFKSNARHITLEEYMEQFDVDIDAEYEAGILPESIRELKDFKEKHLSHQVSL